MLLRGMPAPSYRERMLRTRTWLLLSLLAINTKVVAQDTGNWPSSFLYPVGDLTFNTNDTVIVSYLSPFQSPEMYIWCTPGYDTRKTWYSSKIPPFNGTVGVQLNFTSTEPCWFNLRRNNTGPDGANGHEFSVLDVVRKDGPQTFSLVSTSTSSTSATTTPTGTTTSVAAAGTSDTAPAPTGGTSSGLSAGAIAGIVIGAVVAVIAIFFGVLAYMARWKRSVREAASAAGRDPSHAQDAPEAMHGAALRGYHVAENGHGYTHDHEQKPWVQVAPQEMDLGHEAQEVATAGHERPRHELA
ncbi:hypothetical protein B0T22DRAFT_165747 [Podospora appendiculata]|uniref:Mid2 domain-containing protein n=1 Tax=Podospora appendiculata TaxID=314037 RepID=A0AAE0XAE5_9PEZI|nr:hypothetical protein B0T22DRAFT_165747 [Podospora appendiculata]